MTTRIRLAVACFFLATETSASMDLERVPHELEPPASGAHAHDHNSLLRGSARRPLSVIGMDESGINCDFDLSFCNFTGSWSRTNGYTPTGNGKTGPKADNTVGDEGGLGYYAYAEANGNANADVSMFINLEHDFSALGVHFYYHMFGVQIGTLALAVSTATDKGGTASDDGEWEDVWSLTGNQLANNQAQFEYAYVLFDSTVTGVRRFRFTSTPFGNSGDAAIDDFKVIALPTPVPTPTPTPEPSPVPTLLPSISKLPSGVPTPLPTQVPTKPTAKPTRLPTQVPSPQPSPLPTMLPSISTMPTPVPSPLPSALPTLPPTVLFRVKSDVLAANLTVALYAFLGLLLLVATMAWLAVWRNERVKAGQRREAIRVAERKKLRKQKRAKMLAKASGREHGGKAGVSGLAGSYLADRNEPSSSGTEDDFADLSSDSDNDIDNENNLNDYEKWARREELAAMRAETALGAGSRRTTQKLLKVHKAKRAYAAAATQAQTMASAIAERSASASRSLGRSIERAVSIGRDSSAGRAMTASIDRITRSFSGSGNSVLGSRADTSANQNEPGSAGQATKPMPSRVLSHRVRKDFHALRSCLDAADLSYLSDTFFGAGIATPRQVANLEPNSPAPGLLGLTNQEQASLRELIGAARSLGVHAQDAAFSASALRRAVTRARESSQHSIARSPFPGMDGATLAPFSSVAATAAMAVESLGVATGLDTKKPPAREKGANGRYQMHRQTHNPVDEDQGAPALAEPKSEKKSAGPSSKKSAPKSSAKASSSKAQPPQQTPHGGAAGGAAVAEKRSATTWGEDSKEGHHEDLATFDYADNKSGLSGGLSTRLEFAKMPMNLDAMLTDSLWGGKSTSSHRAAQPSSKAGKGNVPREADVSPSRKASKKRNDDSTKVETNKSKAKAKKKAAAAAAAAAEDAKTAAEAQATAEAEEAAAAASTGMSGWGVPQRGELTGRLTPFPDRWAGQGPKSPSQAAAAAAAASSVNQLTDRHAPSTPAPGKQASSFRAPVLTRREQADAAEAEAAAAMRERSATARAQTLAANEANLARRVSLAQQHPGRRPSVMANLSLKPASSPPPLHQDNQRDRASQSSPDKRKLAKRTATQDDKKSRNESAVQQNNAKKKTAEDTPASQPAAPQSNGDVAAWFGGAGLPGFTL